MVLTSSSHIFCCVLPTAIGVINVFANLGIASIWVPQFNAWHEMMHAHEMQILMFSGVMLGIAALVDMVSIQIDCHSTGCTHGCCEPVKDRATLILLVASVLFAFNTATYYFGHKAAYNAQINAAVEQQHQAADQAAE